MSSARAHSEIEASRQLDFGRFVSSNSAPAVLAHGQEPWTDSAVLVEPQSREEMHAAALQVADKATGPDGQPLNILETLTDTFHNDTWSAPLHVQGTGCLVVCSLDTGIISHCSENVHNFLDREPADLLAHDIREIIPPDVVQQMFDGAVSAQAEAERVERAYCNPTDDQSVTAMEEAMQSVSRWVEAMKLGDVSRTEIGGRHFMVPIEINGRELTVIAHRPDQSDRVVMDIMPMRPPTMKTHDLGVALSSFISTLNEADNIYRGAQLIVEHVNAVLLYDRSILYRILPPDYHAEAIAEERRIIDLYPFLGLKFPPVAKADRQKYVELSFRGIEDTTSFTSLIIGSFDHAKRPFTIVSPKGTKTTMFPTPTPEEECTPTEPKSAPPQPASSPRSSTRPPVAMPSSLNLSHSMLRTPNPTHMGILRSLAIRGTTCISITVQGRLYGVLAFYAGRETNNWCWDTYQFVRAATMTFASWIGRQEIKAREQQQSQLTDLLDRLTRTLDQRFECDPHCILRHLVFGKPDFCEIAGSDTFAFCCGSNWLRVGSLPSRTWLEQFLAWVINEAPDHRVCSGADDWGVSKMWSTVNLTQDYSTLAPDPRVASGALAVVINSNPITAFLCFRSQAKAAAEWDGTSSSASRLTAELSPGRASPGRATTSPSGPLTVAEITAFASGSPYAQQFLRAFRLATHTSCPSWPVIACPLLKVVCHALTRYADMHGWEPFFKNNMECLMTSAQPENTLLSRLLREEIDGLLLLCRDGQHPSEDHTKPRERHDRVLCVNRGWCEVFGFVDETAALEDRDIEQSLLSAGVPLASIMHPIHDTSHTITVWSRKKGHTTLFFKCFHVFSVQSDGAFNQVLAFTFTDVTVQQRVEQALLLAHEQSRRSEQAKQRMIGMVSHELRTPLTAILGFSEILQSDLRLTHEQQEFVSDIHSAGSHLLSIITNLLDLTKFELTDSKKQLVDLVEVASEAALWTKKGLASKLLTLHLRLPLESPEGDETTSNRIMEFTESPLPSSVGGSASSPALSNDPGPNHIPIKGLMMQWRDARLAKLFTLGDAVSLKRVLINLLDNAAKFTPKLGTVTVSVRALPPLTPSHPGRVEITVRDTGIGMDSSILAKIWDPFFQADGSTQREMGGAGLGLPMVKSIVELHNGTVSVESEPGVGSKFTISLPMVLRSKADVQLEQEAKTDQKVQTVSPISFQNPHLSALPVISPSDRPAVGDLTSLHPSSRAAFSPSSGGGGGGCSSSVCPETGEWAKADVVVDSKLPAIDTSSGSIFLPREQVGCVPPTVSDARDLITPSSSMRPSRAQTRPHGSGSSPKAAHPEIKLMVVDDSEVNRKLFCRLLAMEGFTNVETASNGLECFGTDTRVLTDQGFMFVDQVEAAIVDKSKAPLFACYDKKSRRLEYHRGELVTPPNRHGRLITLTTPTEDESGVSIRVTPNHDVFVSQDAKPSGGDAFHKMPAHELLSTCACAEGESCCHRSDVYLLSHASEGVARDIQAETNLATELNDALALQSQEQADAFLRVYGFWLANGTMDDDPEPGLKFHLRDSVDVQFLQTELTLIGLTADDWRHDNATCIIRVTARCWCTYFGAVYGGSQNQKFFWWVSSLLDKRQLRLLISNMQRPLPDSHLFTSSASFRDELMQVLLHVGYSPYFECVQSEHGADSWRVTYADASTPQGSASCMPRLPLQTGVSQEVYSDRVWCVRVDHADHLIVVQRASRDSSGLVVQASRPVIIGQCIEQLISHRSQAALRRKKHEDSADGPAVELTPDEVAGIHNRASVEAQSVAKDLLARLRSFERKHANSVLSDLERQQLLQELVDELTLKSRAKSGNPSPLTALASSSPGHPCGSPSCPLPHLLVIDLHMPVLDGFQTALALHRLGFDMPIVALTASVGDDDQMMASQLGFYRYLTKPIQRQDLREVLDFIVQKRVEKRERHDKKKKSAHKTRFPSSSDQSKSAPRHADDSASTSPLSGSEPRSSTPTPIRP